MYISIMWFALAPAGAVLAADLVPAPLADVVPIPSATPEPSVTPVPSATPIATPVPSKAPATPEPTPLPGRGQGAQEPVPVPGTVAAAAITPAPHASAKPSASPSPTASASPKAAATRPAGNPLSYLTRAFSPSDPYQRPQLSAAVALRLYGLAAVLVALGLVLTAWPTLLNLRPARRRADLRRPIGHHL